MDHIPYRSNPEHPHVSVTMNLQVYPGPTNTMHTYFVHKNLMACRLTPKVTLHDARDERRQAVRDVMCTANSYTCELPSCLGHSMQCVAHSGVQRAASQHIQASALPTSVPLPSSGDGSINNNNDERASLNGIQPMGGAMSALGDFIQTLPQLGPPLPPSLQGDKCPDLLGDAGVCKPRPCI